MRNRHPRPLSFSCGLVEKIITLVVVFFFSGGEFLNVFLFSRHSSTFLGFCYCFVVLKIWLVVSLRSCHSWNNHWGPIACGLFGRVWETMEIKTDMVSLGAFPVSTFKAVLFTSIWDYTNPRIGWDILGEHSSLVISWQWILFSLISVILKLSPSFSECWWMMQSHHTYE